MMCPKFLGRKSYISMGECLDNARAILKLDVSSKDPKKKAHPEKAADWTFGNPMFEPEKVNPWLWHDENGSIRAE